MELRECPFCGAATDHKDDCYFSLLPLVVDKWRLHKAWNRRASPASVPANFKMVPVEPTMEMCEAGWNEYDLQEDFSVRFMYERMLSAAPTPPVSEDRKDAERYHKLANYMIGTRFDIDDALVAASSIDEISSILDAMQEDKP